MTSPPTSTPRFSGRNAGIDLLRGLSILLVILQHTGLRIPFTWGPFTDHIPHWVRGFAVSSGYPGVFIFFVVSGFVIAMHSLRRWGSLSAINAPVFYWQRATRILPTLFLLVAVLSLLNLVGLPAFGLSGDQSLARAVLSALTFHLNYYEGFIGQLPLPWEVLWSLSIEETFYLAFPIVCLLVTSERWLMVGLFLLAITLPWTRAAIPEAEVWQQKAYMPGLSAIALGVWGALLAHRHHTRKVGLLRALAATAWFGLVVVFCFNSRIWDMLGNGSFLLLAFCSLCLVLSFHWRAEQTDSLPWYGTAWLGAAGRLSYEIYLSHVFVVFAVEAAYHRFGAGPEWGGPWYLVSLLTSWGLGWMLARHFSQPVERALRQRFRPGAASDAAAVASAPTHAGPGVAPLDKVSVAP